MQSIELEIKIHFQSKWHSGSGEGGLLYDRLIRRDAHRWPFIPGSTLKGVIREHCEKLSRLLDFPDPVDPHKPDITQIKKLWLFHEACSPVDLLFGSNYKEGGLFFRDARLIKAPVFDSFDQSRICRYRVLGTAKDKHLFTNEYAQPMEFHSTITGYHANLVTLSEGDLPFGYCLLIAGILSVDRLGGDKSSGCGKVKLEVVSPFYYNRQPLEVEEIFQYLDKEFISASYKDPAVPLKEAAG
jgi:CRISPR/Cas system CSM-associated protein Csm3 (group 7 of RAMP superfamily)